MPLCVKCSNPLECTCGHEQPIGESIIGCPFSTAPGAIWVHVTDDAGKNLPGVPVAGFADTNGMGLTIREEAEGPVEVELTLPPKSPLLERHDAPAVVKKSVNVHKGTIAYVSF